VQDKEIPKWMGRPISSHKDAEHLDREAAIAEFEHGLPRHQAEAKAYEKYARQRRAEAAAHHLLGMMAARAGGAHQESQKHAALYEAHARALGVDPGQPPPPEVQKLISSGSLQSSYKFKNHHADIFTLNDAPTHTEDSGLQKAEPQCEWKLGDRRCQNYALIGTKSRQRFCRVHQNSRH